MAGFLDNLAQRFRGAVLALNVMTSTSGLADSINQPPNTKTPHGDLNGELAEGARKKTREDGEQATRVIANHQEAIYATAHQQHGYAFTPQDILDLDDVLGGNLPLIPQSVISLHHRAQHTSPSANQQALPEKQPNVGRTIG